jgi:hypothetical protein
VLTRHCLVVAALLATAGHAVAQAPEEIRLWPGKAPGSETWTIPESTAASPSGDRTIVNVSDPTVAVFLPPAASATGTAHAPPLFIAVGSTHFNVTNGCLALFAAWKAAGKPAGIHVYDQVSAGFGMTKRGLPVDSWTDRLLEWLTARKLI